MKLNGAVSELSVISSGVPQGGHLSPLLFIIFVNSIQNCFSFTKVLLFADDIKIFCKIDSPSDCLLLQTDLDAFFEWTQLLNLPLNLDKCHSMTFCRKRSPILHSYYLGSSPFLRVHLIKDLGFYLSPTLSFKHHLNVTIEKSVKILGFIKRNTTLFTSATYLRTLYFSLVH